MAEIFQRRTLSGWVPADPDSEALWRRQKVGKVYRAKIAEARNYRHHCLFMVLLNEVTFPNQERYTNDKDFRRAVAYAAGHVEEFVTMDGEIHRQALPYDYEHLPEESEFTKAFGAAMTVCSAILRHTAPELEEHVARYANENYGIDCPAIFRETVQEQAA